jgi:hypothetical protein
VPFETVAKVSLITAAFLFVVDPIPPYSRLIPIVSCFTVLKLNKNHHDYFIKKLIHREEEQASIEIVTDSDRSESAKEGK